MNSSCYDKLSISIHLAQPGIIAPYSVREFTGAVKQNNNKSQVEQEENTGNKLVARVFLLFNQYLQLLFVRQPAAAATQPELAGELVSTLWQVAQEVRVPEHVHEEAGL